MCTSPAWLWIPARRQGSWLWTSVALSPYGLGLGAVEVVGVPVDDGGEENFSDLVAIALADGLQVVMHLVHDHEQLEHDPVDAEGQQ